MFELRKKKKRRKFKIANSQIADNQNVRAANFLYVISTWLASEETQTGKERERGGRGGVGFADSERVEHVNWGASSVTVQFHFFGFLCLALSGILLSRDFMP